MPKPPNVAIPTGDGEFAVDDSMKQRRREILHATLRGEMPLVQILSTLTPEHAWRDAIRLWYEGSSSLVDTLLRDDRPIPEFARHWLVDALAGRERPRRGPKGSVASMTLKKWMDDVRAAERVKAVYAEHLMARQAERLCSKEAQRGARDISPSEEAIEDTAAELGLTSRQVSDLVHPRARRRAR